MKLTIQIDHVGAFNLVPDDIIVVTLSGLIEPDRMAELKKQLTAMFPDHQVLVKEPHD
jgi:hypothetical protein